MEQAVGFESFDRLGKGEAAVQGDPLSGVTVPRKIEAIAADPIEASERGIELIAEILRKAGAIALDEAISGAMPPAEDVDGIVELGRLDGGQKARPEEPVDQLLAGGNHRRFFCR